jgi:hypothetical protein
MLKNEIVQNIDLVLEKQKVVKLLPAELRQYVEPVNAITTIKYPVEQFPKKIISIGFDKIPEIEGILSGIKGQYLIFNDNRVLNIRKHNGYFLQLDF